jgi:site-specific DNA-cytosine methylase
MSVVPLFCFLVNLGIHDRQSVEEEEEDWEPEQAEEQIIPDMPWSDKTATTEKHRPQVWDRPSTTVVRNWARWSKEAHLLDVERHLIRRLTMEEMALLQSFPQDYFSHPSLDHLSTTSKIQAIGNAVPPLLSQAVFAAIEKGDLRLDQRGLDTFIDICAGAGGLALGHKWADPHARALALVDNWDVACTILRAHGKGAQQLWSADVVQQASVTEFDFRYVRRDMCFSLSFSYVTHGQLW